MATASLPAAAPGDAGPLPEVPAARGAWIGAAGASDFVLQGTHDTSLGLWIDVPRAAQSARAPAVVAVVIDTSGSMGRPKIVNARAAAHQLVDRLADGDLVALETFDDEARERLPATKLDRAGRARVHAAIDEVRPGGGTNLFDGLRLGEARVLSTPMDHPVRRVVLISDGQANVGPSSPEVLGALAAKGADGGAQVTAIGVGLDYDERTLDTLAIRSSGRLYHVGEPTELPAILEKEMALLGGTAATNAFVEVSPAPGVELHAPEEVRAERGEKGALRIPLGALFGGQHREMLLHARVTAAETGQHALASVRLFFRDPSDGGVERVQEVVARYEVTSQPSVVAAHVNAKTRAIAEVAEAGRLALAASANANEGKMDEAEKRLAEAEQRLQAQAAHATTAADKQRLAAVAKKVGQARASTHAASAAPPAAAPAARRGSALEANHAFMDAAGY